MHVPLRRRLLLVFWHVVNPLNRRLAGFAPWWVLLETTGSRTGRRRTTPLAAGPADDGGMWLIAVQGQLSAWVANVRAHPGVRLRHRGRWHDATASVQAFDAQVVRRFNAYARTGPRVAGIDPVLVRVDFLPGEPGSAARGPA